MLQQCCTKRWTGFDALSLFAQVTEDLLPFLTGEDLVSMGITSLGPRRRILEAIAARPVAKIIYRQDSTSASAVSEGPSYLQSQQDVLNDHRPHQGRDLALHVNPDRFPLSLVQADKGKITGFFHRICPADNASQDGLAVQSVLPHQENQVNR